MNQRGEALLAVIGAEAFLGDTPIRVTQEHRAQAAKLQRYAGPRGELIANATTIRSELRRFLTSEDWDRERALPEFRYKRALDQLTEPEDPERLARKLAKLADGDEMSDLLAAAQTALGYLRTILPRHVRQTPTGPVSIDPNAAVLGIFRRSWGVANRPLVVLEDLNEGILARDQVRALEGIFPTIYDAIKAELLDLLVDLKTRSPKFELTHKRSKQLSVLLLDAGAIDKGLSKVLQDHFTAEPQGGGKPTNVDAAAEGVDLPTRRIEAR